MNSEQNTLAEKIQHEAERLALVAKEWDEDADDLWSIRAQLIAISYQVARALEQPASAAGVEGWRPIETAPKGDGVVLIGWGEYRERDGYSPAFMRWYDFVGGWTVNAMPFYPTHWMPLPAAPKPEDAS